MRKNIGWQERQDDIKYQIRVIFNGGPHLLWRRISKSMERWEPFAPSPEHWQILLEKTHARYVRRQAPYKDLQLIERLAAQAAANPPPPPRESPPPPPP